MSLLDFAKNELNLAGVGSPEADYGGALNGAVLELIEVFCEQGHSGGSAPMVRSMFNKLADWKPLTPLTGADTEWNEVGTGVYQNNRCSSVFKNPELGAYDIDAFVLTDEDGCRYTSFASREPVTFPYTPKTTVLNFEESTARIATKPNSTAQGD